MRFCIQIFLWLFIFNAFASIGHTTLKENTTKTYVVSLSRTFKIKIPFKVLNQMELTSLKSKIFRLELAEQGSTQLIVQRNQPKTLANIYSAERYWKAARNQTSAIDKNESNLGCSKITNRFFTCSRDVAQNGKFFSETLYWNAKNDLITLRVTSLKSFEQSRMILNEVKVIQDARLPAAVGQSQ